MSSVLGSNLPAHERLETVQSYMDSLDPAEKLVSQDIAERIAGDKPLADTVVIIPVAAHQEAPQIANTLYQYSRQRSAGNFSIVLGLNCPTEKSGSAETVATFDEIEKAKRAHPSLDVRTVFKPYDNPLIGRIRRDLWNGVMRSALDHGQISTKKTILGLNQDIDLESMWPGTINAVQSAYARLATEDKLFPVTGMSMSHGISKKHPNIGRAVSWSDFINRQFDQTFEAALVIPAEMYARADGFDSDASFREVFSRVKEPNFIIDRAYAVTSPRRYLERMATDGLVVWGENTFTPNDAYRVTDDFPDIPFSKAMDIISKNLRIVAREIGKHAATLTLVDCYILRDENPQIFNKIMHNSDFIAAVFGQRLAKKQIVGSRVLRKLTGSDEMASVFTGALPSDIPDMAKRLHSALLTSIEPGQRTIKVNLD